MESFNLCSSASFSLTFPSFRLVSTLSFLFLFRFRFHLILSSQFCSLDSPFAVSCRVNQTIKFGFSHWQKFPSDRALSCCHRHLIVFRSWSQQKRRRRRRRKRHSVSAKAFLLGHDFGHEQVQWSKCLEILRLHLLLRKLRLSSSTFLLVLVLSLFLLLFSILLFSSNYISRTQM